MTTVNFPVCRALRASDFVPREGLAPFDRDGEDDAEGCREENLRSSIDSLFRVDGDRAGTARLGSLVFRRRSPLSAGLGDQAEPTTNFRGMTGLIARIRYVSHHCCSFSPSRIHCDGFSARLVPLGVASSAGRFAEGVAG